MRSTSNMSNTLLTRDDFREGVFARDGGRCVICAEPAQDAHHIIERRMFPDGGYVLDNGASVCGPHHLEAEQTTLSCEALREAAGIRHVVLPPHLYGDMSYDKWGNPILPNGMRLRGELYGDASVQKVIAPVLHLFTDRVKYPRTWHFPWSGSITKDDRVHADLRAFEGREVVATLKMDGEGTTMMRDGIHARSIEYEPHPSRSRIKALWASLAVEIPESWRLCGENLQAQHSIAYSHLPGWFMLFSIWNEKNICLSWDTTTEWAALLDLPTVPVLYRGPWDEKRVRACLPESHNGDACEGYVVRPVEEFSYGDFRRVVGKYVREGHNQMHGRKMRSDFRPNALACAGS